MKDFIILAVFGVFLSLGFYNLGKSQAKLNIHNYDEISSSIKLACTAMINESPTEDVQSNVDSYFFIRSVLGKK